MTAHSPRSLLVFQYISELVDIVFLSDDSVERRDFRFIDVRGHVQYLVNTLVLIT